MVDEIAHEAAINLFRKARTAFLDLPGLIEELSSHTALHRSMKEYVVPASYNDGQDALIENMLHHEKVVEEIKKQMEDLNQVTSDAHRVLKHMDDPGDVMVLRLHYLCGMSERKIGKLDDWPYGKHYVQEKKALALIHAAPVMRKLRLVQRYAVLNENAIYS